MPYVLTYYDIVGFYDIMLFSESLFLTSFNGMPKMPGFNRMPLNEVKNSDSPNNGSADNIEPFFFQPFQPFSDMP